MVKVGRRKATSSNKVRDAILTFLQFWRKIRLLAAATVLVMLLIFLHFKSSEEDKISDYRDEAIAAIYQPIRYVLSWVLDTRYSLPKGEDLAAAITYRPIPAEIQITTLVGENHRLKELLKFREHNKFRTITIRILGQSREMGWHRLFVNAGTAEGLYEGAVIFNQDGLIGQIVSASKHAAWVMTVHDPNSNVPIVLSTSRRKAIANGDPSGGAFLLLQYLVSQDWEEEVALTAGDGGVFPYGLYVGKLIKHNSELKLQSSIKWGTLDYALAVIKYKETE